MKLRELWKLDQYFELIDLEHGYFITRFFKKEDYQKVLGKDHGCLPIEYYVEDFLMKVGNIVGKAVKVDSQTLEVTRGKYARICVEVDLKKPLIPFIWVNNDLQAVEYEGLDAICFECGQYGHIASNCHKNSNNAEGTDAQANTVTGEGHRTERVVPEANPYGPWMLAKQRRYKPKNRVQGFRPQEGSGLGTAKFAKTIGENREGKKKNFSRKGDKAQGGVQGRYEQGETSMTQFGKKPQEEREGPNSWGNGSGSRFMALNEMESEGLAQEKATSRDVLRDIINAIPIPPDGIVFKGTKSALSKQGKEISRPNKKVEVLAFKKQKTTGAKTGGKSEAGQHAIKFVVKENRDEICIAFTLGVSKEGVECKQGKERESWYQMVTATDALEQEKAKNLDPGEGCGIEGFHLTNHEFPALVRTNIRDQTQHHKVVTNIESRGFSGGIWMYWNDREVEVEIVSTNWHIMNVVVKNRDGNEWLMLTIYVSPEVELRKLLWKYLQELGEKVNGPALTWNNCREGGANVGKRLDRALCNGMWNLDYQRASVTHLTRTHSDHHPIRVNTKKEDGQMGSSPFRVENAWYTHYDFYNQVEQNWNNNKDLLENVKIFTEKIKNWIREVFGNILRKKKRCHARINGIQRSLSRAPSIRLQKLEEELIAEYNTILEQEGIMWHQRAKVEWLKYGDGNTRFFHLSTTIRR
ncbi:uncharacterized protein LOC113777945 [Coffea eugenioides]|uniref:uncharacterized protein LOC113777945 n=1 Tax=Coffea eugenioides TaxID=49369 RepID=UPI000F60E112|nr:uncharacterized protein LOC113777945 [Coffea eugenioides]